MFVYMIEFTNYTGENEVTIKETTPAQALNEFGLAELGQVEGECYGYRHMGDWGVIVKMLIDTPEPTKKQKKLMMQQLAYYKNQGE